MAQCDMELYKEWEGQLDCAEVIDCVGSVMKEFKKT